jgi:hypothetical protein
VPCALDGSIRKDVAQVHLEILVGAIVSDGRDAALGLDEAYSDSVSARDREGTLIGHLIDSCEVFEVTGIGHQKGSWFDYPDKFT